MSKEAQTGNQPDALVQQAFDALHAWHVERSTDGEPYRLQPSDCDYCAVVYDSGDAGYGRRDLVIEQHLDGYALTMFARFDAGELSSLAVDEDDAERIEVIA